MAQKTLDLIIKTKKTGTGVKEAEQELKGLNTSSVIASKGQDLLRGAVMGAGFAIANMAVEAVKSIPAMLDQADAIGDAEKALIAYAGSEAEATAASEAIVEASNDTLTSFEANQAAVKLFAQGLVDSAEDAGTLAGQAIILGDAIGKGPTESLEALNLLMTTKSSRSMKALGLDIGLVKKRTDELMASTEGLTEEQAKEIAITEELTRKQQQLEDSGYEVGTSYERLTTRIREAKEEGATAIADFILPIIDANEDHIASLEEQILAAARATDTYGEWLTEIGLGTTLIEGIGKANYEAAEAQIAFEDAVAAGGRGLDGWMTKLGDTQEALEDTEESTDDMKGATDDLVITLGNLTTAELARDAIAGLNQAYADGIFEGNIQEYERQMRIIGENMMGLDPAQVTASIALAKAREDFANTGDIDAYLEIIKGINKELNLIPDDVTTTWTLHLAQTGQWTQSPDDIGLNPGGGGAAAGANFIVPPGYPNDTFPLRVTSGEHVVVTPANQVQNSYNLTINSMARAENLAYDFRFMKQMGGAI